jgi:hypothetical protein
LRDSVAERLEEDGPALLQILPGRLKAAPTAVDSGRLKTEPAVVDRGGRL